MMDDYNLQTLPLYIYRSRYTAKGSSLALGRARLRRSAPDIPTRG